MPNHALASYPGTNSPTVGTSGRTSERVAVVTASARSLPALIYSIDAGSRPKVGLYLSGQQIGQCRCATAIWHVNHLDARHHLEQFAAQMGGVPATSMTPY